MIPTSRTRKYRIKYDVGIQDTWKLYYAVDTHTNLATQNMAVYSYYIIAKPVRIYSYTLTAKDVMIIK